MKVQVKRAFKSHFFVTKKVIKKHALHEILFNSQYQCSEMYISPISNSMPPFSPVPSFLKIISTLSQDNKMLNKHIVDYHPSPSQLTSRIPLIFLSTPKGFISPDYFLNFFLNLYIPPWLWKSFKFMLLLRSLANRFGVKKPPQAEGNYPFLPNSIFWKSYFSQQKGRRIMELKKLLKLNLQRYWSQVLINSTTFATFTFLVSILLCVP